MLVTSAPVHEMPATKITGSVTFAYPILYRSDIAGHSLTGRRAGPQ